MKKLLVGAFLWIFTLAGIAVLPNYTMADDPTVDPVPSWEWTDEDYTYRAQPNWEKQMLSGQELTRSSLLDTIKNAINWILWILATIALIICLYGWFKMVTSAWDENKYKSGLNVLKNAAIGLAIIWLSWMIVSVIFRFVWTLWWWNQTKGSAVTESSNNWNIVPEAPSGT